MTHDRLMTIQTSDTPALERDLQGIEARLDALPTDEDGAVLEQTPEYHELLDEQTAIEDRLDMIRSGAAEPFDTTLLTRLG